MPQCPTAHCSSTDYNQICKDDDFSGSVVYVIGPDGKPCYCTCSCLAYNTPIAISNSEWKKIQDIKVGDTVLRAKENKTWEPVKVAFSDGTGDIDQAFPYAILLRVEGDISLIVTPEHTFLLKTGNLKRADRLIVGDELVNENFQVVKVVEVSSGEYRGGIHNISTTTGGPGEPLWDHLINTAGIISGDFYAQLHLVDEGLLSELQVGSPEYEVQHGFTESRDSGVISKSGTQEYRFSSAKKFKVPNGAVSFLPDYMSEAKEGMLSPLDDTVPLEIAEYLVHHFKRFFPNVTYHIEWNDNTVNAYAWRQGGRRHVAILGGLIRHQHIAVEGLGLVLAHELGHHYGGAPTYPNNGLSCEGQADWWGASIGMREIWWGEEAIRQIISGADQLYLMFTQGLVKSISDEEEAALFDAALGCSHPNATCRKKTYLAAASALPKPSCAGITTDSCNDCDCE